MRRYPRNNGPAALPLFCLAPHGVFPASRITPRAVSSYLAFSPLPVPDSCSCQRTGGVFSVTLSVAAVLQPRHPHFLRGMSPYGVRTFLQQALPLTSDHLPSTVSLAQNRKSGKPGTQEAVGKKRNGASRLKHYSRNSWLLGFQILFMFSYFPDSKWWRHSHEENRDHREGDDEFAKHSSEISQ
jgi:hypothetical protein